MNERMARTIENVQVSSLVQYARNARTHDSRQVEQIARSIETFGFNNPVLIDDENGIIAGHGRVLAAQLLDMDTVPCIRLGWLSDQQKRAFILADNKIAENSGWDEAMLDAELDQLALEGFERDLMGFDIEVQVEQEEEQQSNQVETGEVRDVFWINITGPLKHQHHVLDRLRAVMADIEPVSVELGTVSRG